jgi:DNA-binding GntR family transcriptional regulator
MQQFARCRRIRNDMPRTIRNTRPRARRRSDSHSLVESVYQSLLQRIVSGVLPSGTIVSELALAQDLRVSRTPVHDAVRQLAKDGLVVREGRRRARVANFSADDVYEIFELRKYLEGPAAELAAGRMDRRHCAPLRTAADALAALPPDAPSWTAAWAEFDELFHRTIADASGNRRLAADINRYRLLHKGFNRISTDPTSLQPAMAEHLAILDAIEARDGALARERMVAHIGTWQEFFLRRVFKPVPAQRPEGT